MGLLPASQANAQGYDVEESAWDGLSELVRIAHEEGLPLRPVATLRLGDLSANDAIIILFPTRPLPIASLAKFVEDGGRIVIADDFGEAEPFLSHFDITRTRPSGAASRLRGNPALQIAQARSNHPLSTGVDALLTNHPAALEHPSLGPLYAFDTGGLVITGAVAKGRLIAIGDPSLFINNMLELKSNRRFASNLLRHIHREGGHVYLVTRDGEFHGTYGDPSTLPPVERLAAWLDGLRDFTLPPSAVLWLAALFAALFLIVGASALPRLTPYRRSRLLPMAGIAGGFAARVRFHSESKGSLRHAALSYRFELERALARSVGLEATADRSAVFDALLYRGVPDVDVRELARAFSTLDALSPRQDDVGRGRSIGQRRLRSIVALGERILKRVIESDRHA